jgi:hypothetical protein
MIIERWRTSLSGGDTLFSAEGIAAVDERLNRFERDAAAASGDALRLSELLRELVLDLDRLGGEHGIYGTFLETDEREELVPYLIDVVEKEGLNTGGEDPTEAYRPW